MGPEAKPDPPWRAGAYYLARGNWDRALTLLSGAVGPADSDASALNIRGIAEMMTDHHEQALRTFEEALRKDPSLVEARFNHAVTLLKMKRWDAAANELGEVYEETERLKPAAAFHHALADDGAGRTKAAILWLDRCTGADPGASEAWLYLGVLRERQADYQAAGRAYKQFLELKPNSPIGLLRFGVVAQASGHADTAMKYFRQVVKLAPGTAEAAEANKYLVMWN